MSSALQDVRFAARALRRAPAFTLAAVLTIALGLAGATSIWSVVRTVLVRPLPFADGERLVRVQQTVRRPDGTTGRVGMAPVNFAELVGRSGTIERAVAHRFRGLVLDGAPGADPERVVGIQVTEGWLATVGVRPALGRGFTAEEERRGAEARVVVIGDAVRRRRFDGVDPIGGVIRLNGVPHTVVGVMPSSYAYPYEAQLWLPMSLDRTLAGPRDLNVTARLRPNVSSVAVDAELRALAASMVAAHPGNRELAGLVARPLRVELVGDFRGALVALLAAVGLLLLIACANVASLLLARGTTLARETAIRAALGASRARQLRARLIESLLIALGGGAAGVVAALALRGPLGQLIPEPLRDVVPRVAVDARLLGAALIATLLTGLVFGLGPAWRAASVDPAEALRRGGRGGSAASGPLHALVVLEIAVAFVLLVGGAVLLRDLRARLDVEPGIATDGAVSLTIALPEQAYADAGRRARLVDALDTEVARVPGVVAAGVTTILPFGGGNTLTAVEIAGRADGARPSVNHRVVSPGYFDALGLRVLRGRALAPGDRVGTLPVAVISQGMARRYWPGEDPLGRLVRQGGDDQPWRTVVGVVSDVADGEVAETWYLPYAQGTVGAPVTFATLRLMLVARATGDAARLTPALREAIRRADPGLPVFDATTLDQLRDAAFAEPRLATSVTGGFAVLGLVLALLGVHGVVAYVTARREREIGIRIALGARPGRVVSEVTAGAARLVGLGLLAGAVVSALLTRYLVAMLETVGPRDPLSIAMVALLLGAAAVGAAFLAAWRSARVDPMVVLRRE